ncbi:MAG TPA: hypothetical protein VGN32_03405 [Ktedonobacterales bacterium]|jgi:hypothetical protein|nr:hypothetical protein [Ktedonobacterales bacterium]
MERNALAITQRGEIIRLVGLGVAVLLEAGAVLSVVLRAAFLPLGGLYPPVISVAIFVLPAIVGLLTRRFEVAVLLAVLPFWTLAIVYLAIRQPVWNIDLYSLGILASRVAGFTFLLGALGTLGWFLRRVIRGTTISS